MCFITIKTINKKAKKNGAFIIKQCSYINSARNRKGEPFLDLFWKYLAFFTMVSGYQRDEKMLLNMNNSLTFKKRSARIDWRKIGKYTLVNKDTELKFRFDSKLKIFFLL